MDDDRGTPPLDEGMLAFYKKLTAASPPEAVNWPLAEQRKSWNALCKSFAAPLPPGLRTEDIEVARQDGSVKVRLYRPASDKLRPGVLYMHGGGWVLGGIETHDDMCAEIAHGADVVVAAVDYRLAPEHPHPAQLEDNLAVLHWIRSEGTRHGIDATAVIAAGDSAGGQMSASLALYLRDRKLPQIKGQVLIYPVLGYDLDTPSYQRNADAPCLTRSEMIYYWDAVLGAERDSNLQDKYLVPLAERDFSNLPPAFITAAGYDPLHDEAVLYAEKLKAAGGQAALRREPNLAHSYMRARHVSAACMDGFKAIVSAIRSLAHEGRVVS
jgi:acetyl esterase